MSLSGTRFRSERSPRWNISVPEHGPLHPSLTPARTGFSLLCVLLVATTLPSAAPNDEVSGLVHSAPDRCRSLDESSIRGARVLIGGHDYGRTRFAAELGCGKHRVRVEKTGYLSFKRTLRLKLKGLESVHPILRPLEQVEPPARIPIDQPKVAHAPGPTVGCPITVDKMHPEEDSKAASFPQWLEGNKTQAEQCGISPTIIAAAFRDVRPLGRVVKHDRKQAEYSKTFFEYLNNRVSSSLVSKGRARIKQHRALLAKLEDKYEVPAEILVALWGLESDYGAATGNTPVVAALSTLVYDGRRRDFYQRELLSALRILEQGHIKPDRMLGSWAGAMGQLQFMPSTYLKWGVDADGDERVDIWRSVPDTLESAANYLAGIGWQPGQPWGVEVRLPAGFDAYQARLSWKQSNDAWNTLKVRLADGQSLPVSDTVGSIILPAGIRGPAFLVYANFQVITQWNRSLFYALSVGHLSDRLAGKEGLVGKPPPGDSSLRISVVKAMQADLKALGFDAGKPDGMVGRRTRQALRDYQKSRGIPADAYPTPKLAARLRKEAAAGSGKVQTGLGRQDIQRLQKHLKRLGYQVGKPDGIMGANTRKAMHAYLRDHDLPLVNEPTREIIQRLAREPDA